MVHIVQSAGSTTSYGRGKEAGNSYYKWPSWIPHFGVVVSNFPESVFQIGLKDYDAYDQGRLPFVVDVRAFFRIEDSLTAAQRVSTQIDLEAQLTAVLQGAVRRVLATEHLENIMQDRSTLGKRFTDEVDTQLKEWGVTNVKAIEFMDIRDTRDSTSSTTSCRRKRHESLRSLVLRWLTTSGLLSSRRSRPSRSLKSVVRRPSSSSVFVLLKRTRKSASPRKRRSSGD
jgi:hypothetical protein